MEANQAKRSECPLFTSGPIYYPPQDIMKSALKGVVIVGGFVLAMIL